MLPPGLKALDGLAPVSVCVCTLLEAFRLVLEPTTIKSSPTNSCLVLGHAARAVGAADNSRVS